MQDAKLPRSAGAPGIVDGRLPSSGRSSVPASAAGRSSGRFGIAWTIVLVGFALLLIELVLRTWLASPSSYEIDPSFGPVRRPRARVIESREGYADNVLNSLGLFDAEPSRDGRARALVLGDSFAEAAQVPFDDSFANVAEALLPGVEVINGGLSGLSLPDYVVQLRRLASLEPDVVVVQIGDGDVSALTNPERVHVRSEGETGWSLAIPDFATLHDMDAPGWRLALRRLRRTSALVNESYSRLRLLLGQERARLAGRFSGGAATSRRRAVDVSAPGVSREETLEMLSYLHRELSREARELLYVYVPAMAYSSTGCAVHREDRRQLYREFARQAGAILVDPSEAICVEYLRTRQPLHGFHNSALGEGHLNRRGHRVIGRLLAAALVERQR